MKKLVVLVMAVLLACTAAWANHCHTGAGESHEDMVKGMISLDKVSSDGIVAAGHLKDMKAMMEEMGRPETHHFMVVFRSEATGEEVAPDVSAVRVVTMDGKASKPVALIGMQGHFGADIDASGHVETFELGAKIDGKKYKFIFEAPSLH